MDLLPATLLQQKLECYVDHPALLVPEVRKEFEALKLKLPDIICLLRYMNESLTDQNIKSWRRALKDLEDKVDDIMIYILRRQLWWSPILGFGKNRQLLSFIFRRDHNLKKQLMDVRRLGQGIPSMQIETEGSPAPAPPENACDEITEEKSSLTSLGSRLYGVSPSAYTTPIDADDAKEIEDLLLNHKDERFKLIGVIGRKGIGKRRHVRHVYENEKIKKYFDCYAWISIPSSSSEPEGILREMLRQFYFGSTPYTLETMDKKTLLSAIDKYFVGKRFLLVLDGVSDMRIWESVIFPAFFFRRQSEPIFFRSGFLYDRIVFTSSFPHRRIFHSLVEQIYVEIHLKALQMKPLDLFCQLVFTHTQPPGTCPTELKEIAEEITQQSGQLAFVIGLLAGVLRGNRNPQLWQKRLDQLKELDQYFSDVTVKAILLSYDALPLPLKSCLLYFSIFPEDTEIPLERVIRLWIAEGLVEEETSTSERTETETSMAYLQELVNRELIQPGGHLDVKGNLKSFKFDDQVRRVALHIIGSNKQYLVEATDDISSRTASIPGLRLLSIQGIKDMENIASDKFYTARVRSCIVSGMGEFKFSIMNQCLSRFQLLRVLDLEIEVSDTLPNSLGTLVLLVYLRLTGSKLKEVPASALENLIRLRYLGLRKTGIRELPASLFQLKNLHTLDVRETKLKRLPPWVSQLLHLRHIYLCSSSRRETVEMPLEKEEEKKKKEQKLQQRAPLQLQTLAGVRATAELIKELGNWTQLRKLSIGRVIEAYSKELCASIDKMKFLRSLSIRCEINESLSMGFLRQSTTNLDTLRIGGSVKRLEAAIHFFPSLSRLFLWDNNLTYDPLPVLQGLTNLVVLSLTNTCQVNQMKCDTRGFPELKRLSIFQMRNLERWQIINGGMRKLEFLSIGHCPNLKTPPENLENFRRLQVVMVAGMDNIFNGKMERIGQMSQDHIKVRPIALFKHDFGDTEENPGTKREEVSEDAVVLKLDLPDDKAKQKAMEVISTLSVSGIDSIAVNMKEQKLTVNGKVNPDDIVGKLRQYCHTEIVSVGPANEPEKLEERWAAELIQTYWRIRIMRLRRGPQPITGEPKEKDEPKTEIVSVGPANEPEKLEERLAAEFIQTYWRFRIMKRLRSHGRQPITGEPEEKDEPKKAEEKTADQISESERAELIQKRLAELIQMYWRKKNKPKKARVKTTDQIFDYIKLTEGRWTVAAAMIQCRWRYYTKIKKRSRKFIWTEG